MNADLYFKKSIPFRYRDESLQFRVSQQLFSSHRIDPGTRFLLRSLEHLPVGSVRRLLDVGCGYGAIGLSLLKAGVANEAHLVDRDALAVEYTRQNALLNKLGGACAYGSLGYSDVPDHGSGDFDLITANIPGKAGDRVIASILADAADHLAPEGLAAVVIVDALGEFAADVLDMLSGVEIVRDGERSGHRLFHYRFSGERKGRPADADEALEKYLRDEIEVDLGGHGYGVQVAHGLPDFEGPGIAAGLLMAALGRAGETGEGGAVGIFNPGQGYVPLRVWERVRPGRLFLIGADLLALRYSQRNLTAYGCPEDRVSLHHQIGPELREQSPVALLAALLRGNEDANEAESLAAAFSATLEPGGQVFAAGGSTSVARLVAAIEKKGEFRVVDRKKRRGFGLLIARKQARLHPSTGSG
ncbi:MAG: methyltransferase [Chloroflexi bacterium]|nr:methyltransferase [Chloroflexota bacterium]